MTINITKKQPGSWRGSGRRPLALFVRTSAREWDGIFEVAENTNNGVKRVVREALREYLARHNAPAERNMVRIEVTGSGTQVLQKIKSIFGGDNGK